MILVERRSLTWTSKQKEFWKWIPWEGNGSPCHIFLDSSKFFTMSKASRHNDLETGLHAWDWPLALEDKLQILCCPKLGVVFERVEKLKQLNVFQVDFNQIQKLYTNLFKNLLKDTFTNTQDLKKIVWEKKY